MTERETLLRNLAVGDIFHARSPNGASLICLATVANETVIHARTVTNQLALQFDRQTGVAEWGDERVACKIDSVAPLPTEIHRVFLEMDRKNRAILELDVEALMEREPERFKLTDAEKRALLFIGAHYAANPV